MSTSLDPSATGPWSGGEVPPATRCSRQMTRAARELLGAMGAEERQRLQFPNLGDAARTHWSNLPAAASPRPGIPLGDMSERQRVLVHDLLRASTSSQGYHKLTGAIRADQVLCELGGNPVFGTAHYYVSVFGSPDAADWAWMLTGHHMSAMFTVSSERTAFTPMFTGSQPLQVPSGPDAGWHVLPRDVDRAAELLGALSAEQQRVAVIADAAPHDIIEGPGRRARLQSFQGISSGQLDTAQQRLLWLLIQEFVRNAEVDAAEAQLALVQQTWSEVHFAWQGPPPHPAERFYFRVHGPRILIEYDVQEPLTSQGGHVHGVTRDPTNDYGVDWLGLHYQETPHR